MISRTLAEQAAAVPRLSRCDALRRRSSSCIDPAGFVTDVPVRVYLRISPNISPRSFDAILSRYIPPILPRLPSSLMFRLVVGLVFDSLDVFALESLVSRVSFWRFFLRSFALADAYNRPPFPPFLSFLPPVARLRFVFSPRAFRLLFSLSQPEYPSCILGTRHYFVLRRLLHRENETHFD